MKIYLDPFLDTAIVFIYFHQSQFKAKKAKIRATDEQEKSSSGTVTKKTIFPRLAWVTGKLF